jgi:hypothetical protein
MPIQRAIWTVGAEPKPLTTTRCPANGFWTGRRDAGEVRGVRRPLPRFQLAQWTTRTPQKTALPAPARLEHVLRQESGKDRCVRAVRELSQAFELAVPHAESVPHP